MTKQLENPQIDKKEKKDLLEDHSLASLRRVNYRAHKTKKVTFPHKKEQGCQINAKWIPHRQRPPCLTLLPSATTTPWCKCMP
jgi:hypothetical protein